MLNDDIEPRSVDECRRRTDWLNQKEAIQVELDSLVKLYVDDINLIGTPKELARIVAHLKSEFEMKDLGKT
ncbi:hypothetical protein ACFX2F_034253 [Malus domestica]